MAEIRAEQITRRYASTLELDDVAGGPDRSKHEGAVVACHTRLDR